MKNSITTIIIIAATIFALTSCGPAKKLPRMPVNPGKNTMTMTLPQQVVNEAGDSVTIMYKIFSGTGVAPDKETSIIKAKKDAYDNISTQIEWEIKKVTVENGLSADNKVITELTAWWKEVDKKMRLAFKPDENPNCNFSQKINKYTTLYEISLDMETLDKLMDSAVQYLPEGLSPADTKLFKELSYKISLKFR